MDERAKLSALIRGLMDAVQDSTAVAGQHYIHALQHYFHQEGNRTVPDCVRLEISPGHVMDVPIISLIRLPSYQLEEIDIELSLKLVQQEIKSAVHKELVDGEAPTRASYSVEMCPKGGNGSRRSDHVAVKMKFKAYETTEAYSRALEALINNMQTVPLDKAPERRLLVLGQESETKLEDESPTSSSSTDDEEESSSSEE